MGSADVGEARDRLGDLLERASRWGADGSGLDGLTGFLRSAAEQHRPAFGDALRLALDGPEPDEEAAFAAILEDLLTCAGAAPH
jgi:hypothetical protein